MEVIERLMQIMAAKGITPYKMNKDIGISQSTFSNWKTGKSVPPFHKILEIIQYLEITPNEALGYDTSKDLLTDNEKELLEIFNRMDEAHQLRAIGIVEDYADKHPKEQENKIISTSKIG